MGLRGVIAGGGIREGRLGTWVSSSTTIRLTSGYRALCNNGGIGWDLAAVRLQSLLAATLPLIFGSL